MDRHLLPGVEARFCGDCGAPPSEIISSRDGPFLVCGACGLVCGDDPLLRFDEGTEPDDTVSSVFFRREYADGAGATVVTSSENRPAAQNEMARTLHQYRNFLEKPHLYFSEDETPPKRTLPKPVFRVPEFDDDFYPDRRKSAAYNRLYFFNETLSQIQGLCPRIPDDIFARIDEGLSETFPETPPIEYTKENIRTVVNALTGVKKLLGQERWIQIWLRCCERLDPIDRPHPPRLTASETVRLRGEFCQLSRAYDRVLGIPPYANPARLSPEHEKKYNLPCRAKRIEAFHALTPEWTKPLRSRNFLSTAAVLRELFTLHGNLAQFDRFLAPPPYTTDTARRRFELKWGILIAETNIESKHISQMACPRYKKRCGKGSHVVCATKGGKYKGKAKRGKPCKKGSRRSCSVAKGRKGCPPYPKRKVSRATRARMSAAQKARWARIKG